MNTDSIDCAGAQNTGDVQPAIPRPMRDLFGYVLFVFALLFCLTPLATAPLALGLGTAVALTVGNPFAKAGHRLSKVLLQASVVLLGFGMNLRTVLKAGASGALFATATISLTLLLGFAAGKLLRVGSQTSMLISVGTAICGGSAIAATGSVINAEEADMTVAMGVVFLLNGAALYLFPPLGHALHLTSQQFGTWTGVAIHDVSSVVGAASQFGTDALQTATAVKLSRALWIVPLTTAIALMLNREKKPAIANAEFGFASEHAAKGKVQVPWFIGLFLVASLCRSFVPAVEVAAPTITRIARVGLIITLFLIGAGLSKNKIKTVGWRALVQGIALWLVISVVSFLVIVHL